MQRFTAYRLNISQRGTHNEFQRNADNEPQFEGVIFSDGKVVIHWMTPGGSVAVWNSIEDCLNVHGHPEYGTVILWHDGQESECWTKKVNEYRIKERSVVNG